MRPKNGRGLSATVHHARKQVLRTFTKVLVGTDEIARLGRITLRKPSRLAHFRHASCWCYSDRNLRHFLFPKKNIADRAIPLCIGA